MTNGLAIEAVAKEPRQSASALAARLADLRSQGNTLIECIKYVKLNQKCSLAEAKKLVINSPAWADRKDDFLRLQQEMFEEFLACNRDMVEEIKQTITSDGTESVVRIRSHNDPN